MGRWLGGAGKRVIEGCTEAQHLALAAKHLSWDPYRLWNIGRQDLPPHPRPTVYRALIFAMGTWLEDREQERAQLSTTLGVAAGVGLAFGGGQQRRRRPPPRRGE